MKRNYMPLQTIYMYKYIYTYIKKKLLVHLPDSEYEWSFNCYRCTFQNATYFTSFHVTEKYPELLKIDWYRDGCYLKHILRE